MSELHVLAEEQASAVEPAENVWLSASAGTGKTQVLTARVFRLLLRENVDPEHLLCLTFTKAGAAEMAERIHRQLAAWVRMPQKILRQDLYAIGASNDPETQERARTLFAKVLDARGGGLRIMTIHSFCQTLLASFPEEAGISAMFKPIEERDQKILAREALSDLLREEEEAGREEIIKAVQSLSIRMGEEATEQYLMTCASEAGAMEALPSGILPFVRQLLKLPIDIDARNWLAAKCTDTEFEIAKLDQMVVALQQWPTKTAEGHVLTIQNWIASDPEKRAQCLPDLHKVWAKVDGDWRSVPKGLAKVAPEYEQLSVEVYDHCKDILATAILFEYADMFAGALEAGRAFYHKYDAAKKLHGVVDFDDMIRKTAQLLQQGDMAAWIRYKLDQRTDHILIDEAQDTNMAQWDIVHALADEFFAGIGAHPERLRTVFTVGDFKQAIFGFQGTSPHNYTQARKRFFDLAKASERPFADLPLNRSFRTTPPVLQVVDATLEQLSHDQLGMDQPIKPHRSNFQDIGGSVSLWRPIANGANGDPDDEESWVNDEKRVFAQRLALQIKEWLNPETGLWLEREGRWLEAGDVMILVSKRDELSALIVARLFAENVPVAGIDRIRLNQPLVVQDMLAAVRFVLQPHDDLNLASLLVSPLIDWSQETLLERAYRDGDNVQKSLWDFVKHQDDREKSLQPLHDLLRIADFNTPYQFLETILSGTLQGRMKLTARLGHAALDPMEELLTTALAFEQDHVPSLQGFLDWFDRGDVEIKREQDEGSDEVRLMTVHGAKGLQAPLVILANATFDPASKQNRGFGLKDPMRPDESVEYPVVPVRKQERVGLLDAFATVAEAKDLQEHWRLLYVAMTRAEEHLVIAGTLGPRANGQVPELSWYSAVERGLMASGCDWEENARWVSSRTFGMIKNVPDRSRNQMALEKANESTGFKPPEWLFEAAPEEARPPRPLTPSDLGPDDASSPPAGKSMREAAERGNLLHSLFQRLPDIEAEKRKKVADRWLEKQKAITDPARRRELVDIVLAVLATLEWSDLFSENALAEAPIAAVSEGFVVSGTVDRLLVTDDYIFVVDFKTGRRVPDNPKNAPKAYLRQMAAYVVALEQIFPGRPIRAALLYTHAPAMLELPQDLIDRHKPSFERG